MKKFIYRVIFALKLHMRSVFKSIYKITTPLRKKKLDMSYMHAQNYLNKLSPKPDGSAVWTLPDNDVEYDLSIIIPFYNTEKFARRCIESALSQNTKFSYEVILVDDGSPDNCAEILDSYKSNPAVKVVHKSNGGLSEARNTGMKIAKGQYFFFLDSDDILFPDSVELLMSAAKKYNADIVEGSMQIFDKNNRKKNNLHSFSVRENGLGLFGYACGKVIKRTMFNSICFPNGYWYEDTIILYFFKICLITAVTIPGFVYGYYKNPDGITAKSAANPKSVDTVYIIDEMLSAFENLKKPVNNFVRKVTINQLSARVINRTINLSNNDKKAVFIAACEIAEKYNLFSVKTDNYYEQEIIEAFKNKQYTRWKWASILL